MILAKEATAALQSTEDFSLVKLRKVKTPGKTGNGETVETGGVPESSVTNLLLKIKGIENSYPGGTLRHEIRAGLKLKAVCPL